MKAFVCTAYGPPDVLELREVEKPTPEDDAVLIEVVATTVTSGDWRVRSLRMPNGFGPFARLAFGLFKPRQPILGTELAGVVASVGSDVTEFSEGDEVVAFSDAGMGCHAEYKTMPESGAVARKPSNLTFEEAAALSFGGTTALEFFRWGDLQEGERVLINGASGSVGTAAVQLATHLGAEVTGVCSTPNLELVTSIGANRVIDYTTENILDSSDTYDVIVDTAGTIPVPSGTSLLAEGGRLLLVNGTLPNLLRSPWVSMTSSKTVIGGAATGKPEDLQVLAELAEGGHYTPVIDRSYPFEQMVEAHRRVDQGRKAGNVVLTLQERRDA